MPKLALAEGAVGDVNPATAAFHQADRVQGAPVEAAPGAGVLEPLDFAGRVAVAVRRLTQGLVMAVVTTTKGDIKTQWFYISKDRKWTQFGF